MPAHKQAHARVRHPVVIPCCSLSVYAGMGMIVCVRLRPCIAAACMRSCYYSFQDVLIVVL